MADNSRSVRNGSGLRGKLAAAALLSCLPLAANATTVVFDWVSTSVTAGQTITPAGTLTLTLPNTVTTQTFNTGSLGSSALAAADITGFAFEFSDGLSVGLSNLTSKSITENTSVNPAAYEWYTSNTVTTSGGPTGVYLITGFTLAGSKVFPGDPRAANFQIASSAGQVSLVGPASNNITPFAGQGAASVDAGYWELQSIQTSSVPLPAAGWMLVSGLAGLLRFGRSRTTLSLPA